MKHLKYSLAVAALLSLAACSSDPEEPLAPDYSGVKVQPEVSVEQNATSDLTKVQTDDGQGDGTGSTYFKVGDEMGFLLIDERTGGLYSDTGETGILRYVFDGTYWATEDSYGMTEDNCRVFCHYPYQDHTVDGTYPNIYRDLETASNTDYLFGIARTPDSQSVNGMTPQVHMRMYHVLTRISFQLKRGNIPSIEGNNVGAGHVTAFTAYGHDAQGRSVHGSTTFNMINGEVVTPVTSDNSPVAFTETIIGESIPAAAGSTLGDWTEFMSAVPFTGTIDINLTIDGQNYSLTTQSNEFKAGTHCLITLTYNGSQVVFPNADGSQGSAFEIIPWTSGGSIGVKGNNRNQN